jgi:hypothetical protein
VRTDNGNTVIINVRALVELLFDLGVFSLWPAIAIRYLSHVASYAIEHERTADLLDAARSC